MTESCPRIEELDRLSGLAAGEPERAHLDGCARCRARLVACDLFRTADPGLPGARVEEARRELDRFIDREFGAFGPAPVATRRAVWRLSWRWPAFVLAPAVVVVAMTVLTVDSLRERRATPVWRGALQTMAWSLHPPRLGAGGSVELSWRRFPGVDGYQVRFYSADLKPIYQSQVTPDTLLALDDAAAALRQAKGSRVLWRVGAYRATVEVGTSPVRLLSVP